MLYNHGTENYCGKKNNISAQENIFSTLQKKLGKNDHSSALTIILRLPKKF